MKNIDAFNTLVGWILARLYQAHPRRINIEHRELPDEIRLAVEASDDKPIEFWRGTFLWLQSNGFIEMAQPSLPGKMFGVCLTMLGFQALNSVPESVSGEVSAGERLIDAVKGSGTEARTAAIGEIVGHVIGGLARSISGT